LNGGIIHRTDGSRAAHVEHTLGTTDGGLRILAAPA
jgi:hypothetical protein